MFDPKRSLAQNVNLAIPKSNPGSKNPPKDSKIQKMRAKILCRSLPSELQTEPYGTSYGPKPLWGNATKFI